MRYQHPRDRGEDVCSACVLESGEYDEADLEQLREYAYRVYRRLTTDELRSRILRNALVDDDVPEEVTQFTKWHLLILNRALFGVRPPVQETVTVLREQLYESFSFVYSDDEPDPSSPFRSAILRMLAVETALVEPVEGIDTGGFSV